MSDSDRSLLCHALALCPFVDDPSAGIAKMRDVIGERRLRRYELCELITALVGSRSDAAARLRELCERDLPEFNRHILSRAMGGFITLEAVVANLNLIDDAKPSPVPRGVWDQLNGAFVERRPDRQDPNVFMIDGRASNELRTRLFRMVLEDCKRRNSAFMLLGQIEVWRLEYGRPTDEPRHPDLASGQPWPPMDFLLHPKEQTPRSPRR